MPNDIKSAIKKLKSKLTPHKMTKQEYKESFFKTAEIPSDIVGYKNAKINNISLSKTPKSLQEFNKMLTHHLAGGIKISNVKFGEYGTYAGTAQHFRAELENGSRKLIVALRHGSQTLEAFLPEEDKENGFVPYATGKQFETINAMRDVNREKTGGVWNEEKITRSVPVFELGENGKISQIGVNYIKGISHSSPMGSSWKEINKEFISSKDASRGFFKESAYESYDASLGTGDEKYLRTSVFPSSLQEFRDALSSVLKDGIEIQNAQCGEYAQYEDNPPLFRAEISNGERNLVVTNEVNWNILHTALPEDDKGFVPYEPGQRICKKHMSSTSREATGGAWNETLEKTSTPVLEFSANGSLKQIGKYVHTVALYHGAGGGGAVDKGTLFISEANHKAGRKILNKQNNGR